MEKRHKFLSAVHLILEKENQILLLKRYNTGYEDGNYGVVQGHVDSRETILDAMIREAKEEADLLLKKQDLIVVHIMHRCFNEKKDSYIDFFIKTKKYKGIPRIMENNKCDKLKWFKKEDLPDNIIPYIRKALSFVDKKILYSEYGFVEK